MKYFFRIILIAVILAGWNSFTCADENEPMVGDKMDGSRTPAVHILQLFDREGQKISLEDQPLMPFSNEKTCGECHDVNSISKGWHFNYTDKSVDHGRPGQPWFYVDPDTATQIPVSYRKWQGVYHPKEIGMRPWDFAKTFGRQLPGGISEKDETGEPDFQARWLESGALEINCLACHDAEPVHDQSEYAIQVFKENFMWAGAATSAFTKIKGSAKDMPDMWDPYLGGQLNDPKLVPPTVFYDEYRFDRDGKVFFDVARKIPNRNCYFCHSNTDIIYSHEEKWIPYEDVHLGAGISCVDCHKNGLSHQIIRGYEGEEKYSDNPLAGKMTCENCHQKSESEDQIIPGVYAAPEPEHKGIPPIHFEKLTCTACHSGPWPEGKTRRTQTARAHGLGVHGLEKTDEMLPHIYYPVFIKNGYGKLTPCKAGWPSFWAIIDSNSEVEPLSIDELEEYVHPLLSEKKKDDIRNWPKLSTADIQAVLKELSDVIKNSDEPVYIGGGKIYRLVEGAIVESSDKRFGPVAWPVAHNVRPAEQSLGVASCQDCHKTDSDFFFSKLPVDSPLKSDEGRFIEMTDITGYNKTYFKLYNFAFKFRPVMKVLAVIVSVIILIVIAGIGFKFFCKVSEMVETQDEREKY